MANEGGGGEAQWAPQKLPSSLQIYRMTSRPLKTVSVLLVTSPRPAFWSQIKNIWLLHSPKTFFFKESQHDKIVYNDTIFIKKSILIEIKFFIFGFSKFHKFLKLWRTIAVLFKEKQILYYFTGVSAAFHKTQ